MSRIGTALLMLSIVSCSAQGPTHSGGGSARLVSVIDLPASPGRVRLSPEGDRLVFTVWESTEDDEARGHEGTSELWLSTANGESRCLIKGYVDFSPAWGAGGDLIAFVRRSQPVPEPFRSGERWDAWDRLNRLRAEGSEDLYQAALLDYWMRSVGGSTELLVLSLSTGELTAPAQPKGFKFGPKWFPNRAWVAYGHGHTSLDHPLGWAVTIAVTDTIAGSVTQLSPGPLLAASSDFAVSAGGDLLAGSFSAHEGPEEQDYQLWLYDFRSRSWRELMSVGRPLSLHSLAFLPGGRQIGFLRSDYGTAERREDSLILCRYDLRSDELTEAIELTAAPGHWLHFGEISPDGLGLATTEHRKQGDIPQGASTRVLWA